MLKLFGFVGNKISNVIRNANNDGPPDLDELVKDLKSKVNNVFKLKPKNTNILTNNITIITELYKLKIKIGINMCN